MPTRFRYAKVAADSYSLTAADILVATDAELNQYIGVKKYAPYRTEQRWDPKRGERLHELKQVLEERGVAWGGEADRPVKKRKGKKERMKAKELAAEEAADQPEEPEEPENSSKSDQGKIHEHVHAGSVETGSRKRKRKRHKNVE